MLLTNIEESQHFFGQWGLELNEFMAFVLSCLLSFVFLLLFAWAYVNLFPATKAR